MNKRVFRWLYRRYSKIFQEIIVEDTFVLDVPKPVTDSAMKFLASNRRLMEPWLTWQAYQFQRRYVSVDKSNADVWLGCLFMTKVLYLIASTGVLVAPDEISVKNIKTEETPPKPVDVDEFVSKMKDLRDKPADKSEEKLTDER